MTTVFDQERGIGIVLPPAGPGVQVPRENVLQLRVLPDGVVDVISGGAGRAQRITADEVVGAWRLAAGENPLLIAAVETHPEAPYYRMVDVLDALRKAGAERVSLKRLEP